MRLIVEYGEICGDFLGQTGIRIHFRIFAIDGFGTTPIVQLALDAVEFDAVIELKLERIVFGKVDLGFLKIVILAVEVFGVRVLLLVVMIGHAIGGVADATNDDEHDRHDGSDDWRAERLPTSLFIRLLIG